MWMMAASIGLGFLSGMANKAAQDRAAAQNAAWARRNNELVMKSNATNQSIINHNAVLAHRETTQEAVEISKNTIRSKGAAEVAMATAGVEGVTADDTIMAITRLGLQAENIRQDEWAAAHESFQNDRERVAQGAAARLKSEHFEGGSGLQVLLSTAKAGLNTYAATT